VGDLEWVPAATQKAMVRLLDHADKVGLTNTEEFTLRAFFMAAAHDLRPSRRFQTEWKKFDLLVQDDDVATLIEFKYYLHRRSADLDGTAGRPKGGAGPKNEAEFAACLAKLRTTAVPGVAQRALVLVYERDDDRGRETSFHGSYGALEESAAVARVWRLAEGPLEARVLQPTDGRGGEDAAVLWADRPHDYDAHPHQANVCVLCLFAQDHPVHSGANPTAEPCWSCGRPATGETVMGTPYCDGYNERAGADCRMVAIYSEMT
jgi:hypothetical protein